MNIPVPGSEWVSCAAYVAAGLCMGAGATFTGAGTGSIGSEAALGAARQPKTSGRTVQLMLLGQAMSETAGIFALVIALLLVFNHQPNPPPGARWVYIVCYLAAGLGVGVAVIGGALGSAAAGRAATGGVARRPHAVRTLTIPMLLGAAVAQSTLIYMVTVAFVLIFVAPGAGEFTRVASLLGAGLCMGFGAVGPAVGSGAVADAAVRKVAQRPELQFMLVQTMLLAMAVTQTTGIYSLVIALVLIFVV